MYMGTLENLNHEIDIIWITPMQKKEKSYNLCKFSNLQIDLNKLLK